jgi:hypothetical protein
MQSNLMTSSHITYDNITSHRRRQEEKGAKVMKLSGVAHIRDEKTGYNSSCRRVNQLSSQLVFRPEG